MTWWSRVESSWAGQLLAAPHRLRTVVFAAAAVAAVLVGFILVPPRIIERLIVGGGYYYILAVFTGYVFFAWRVWTPRRAVGLAWIRHPGWAGVVILAGAVFAVCSDQIAHKVLFDEYVLQGTAWHMHATKEIGTPIRAYEIAGTWLTIDTFLDKRPYFFTFLVSLVHDFTGFRPANIFAVNMLLALVTLALTYWLAFALTRRKIPAMLAVAGLATLPVFGQNATGASMELHNLAMIAMVLCSAVLYLRQPDDDRLILLILGAVLLAQCRYESVLFVGPVALIIIVGWIRSGRVRLPWLAAIAPLLLVPYAWHDRYVQSKPILWQLREGDTARFGLRYLAGNLEGAWKFFFNVPSGQPNSLWLSVIGFAGLGWVLVRVFARWRATRPGIRDWSPESIAIALFGLAVAANLGLLMFYYWSRLDELITARFALPFYFTLSLVTAWFVQWLQARRLPGIRIAVGGLVVWLFVCAAPVYARRLYTTLNLVMQETDWEVEQVSARPGPLLVITNKATMPFLLERIPALNTNIARSRGAQLQFHMQQGTFREVLVTQVLRPTSGDGDIIIDPDDVLPDSFILQPLARKRFGGRWIQVSRIVKIEGDPAALSPGQ